VFPSWYGPSTPQDKLRKVQSTGTGKITLELGFTKKKSVFSFLYNSTNGAQNEEYHLFRYRIISVHSYSSFAQLPTRIYRVPGFLSGRTYCLPPPRPFPQPHRGIIIHSIPGVPKCPCHRRNWVLTPPSQQASVSPLRPNGGSNIVLLLRGWGNPIQMTG
jgi:hypothetical protein